MTGRRILALLTVLVAMGAGAALASLVQEPHATSLSPPQAALAPPPTCSAYAAPTGSDHGSGSSGQPYRTAQKLVRSLLAGQTGCLHRGTYNGDLTLTQDGTTLRSVPGERATLSAATLMVDAGAEDVTVSHLDIVGAAARLTIRVIGDRFTLERNDITNASTGASCVLVGASDYRTTGGTIRANVIHDCGEPGTNLNHGIYAQNIGPPPGGTVGLLIEGNVFYGMAAYAVQLYPRTTAAVVRRNVIDGGGSSIRGGIVIDGRVARRNVIEGNLIAWTKTGAVIQRTGTDHVARDNCLWGNPQGIVGREITSRGNLVADRCWLSPVLWMQTGRPASDELCACPGRKIARCSATKEDTLCRLLAQK